MFSDLKKQLASKFETISSNKENLFYIDIDKEKIWELYLNGFTDPAEKQSHTCNCCKSFLRQFGGVVSIENNKVVSIFDIDMDNVEEIYKQPIKNLRDYIHSLPVSDVFFSSFKQLGTNMNMAPGGVIWHHFSVDLDRKFIKNAASIPTIRGEMHSTKDVFKRSLTELTIDASETVLELIAQNSLYRGKEFESMIQAFLKLQKEYKGIPNEDKDNYCWVKSANQSTGSAVSRIRNTAIGTLLIDVSNGVELDTAVASFERVVAPTNYKRPDPVVTPKMVEAARKKIEEMGFIDSLERRYATVEDLNVNDVLFVDRSSELKTVFDELTKETLVNPKSLSKLDEITIEDFIKNVLPTCKSVEVLLENSHMGNMVSLITAKDSSAPSMFKWDNSFSWSYTGGITDSMKQRVKAAGGKVDGVLRFSIQWNEDGKSICDLDAHAHEPKGTGIVPGSHIYYGSNYRKDRGDFRTKMSGQLDVDMINPRSIGIENIAWSDQNKMIEGIYKFRIHNFSGHKNFSGVQAEIEFNGELYEFSYDKPFSNYLDIAEVTYSIKSGFSIKSLLPGKSSISSTQKWNLGTNQYHKVKKMMLSPNHWEETPVGNKHYLFFLENCISDENPRPFFNEFLKEELNKERKVFEVLGGKLKVDSTPNQLSGLGFSETQKNHLIVRVEGNFKRNLKITF
jgi:hypothetical protein